MKREIILRRLVFDEEPFWIIKEARSGFHQSGDKQGGAQANSMQWHRLIAALEDLTYATLVWYLSSFQILLQDILERKKKMRLFVELTAQESNPVDLVKDGTSWTKPKIGSPHEPWFQKPGSRNKAFTHLWDEQGK